MNSYFASILAPTRLATKASSQHQASQNFQLGSEKQRYQSKESFLLLNDLTLAEISFKVTLNYGIKGTAPLNAVNWKNKIL